MSQRQAGAAIQPEQICIPVIIACQPIRQACGPHPQQGQQLGRAAADRSRPTVPRPQATLQDGRSRRKRSLPAPIIHKNLFHCCKSIWLQGYGALSARLSTALWKRVRLLMGKRSAHPVEARCLWTVSVGDGRYPPFVNTVLLLDLPLILAPCSGRWPPQHGAPPRRMLECTYICSYTRRPDRNGVD